MITKRSKISHVPMIVLLIALNVALVTSYAVPKARIEVLHPKGFSVSIPDVPGIQTFSFHGNLNLPMEGLENGQFSADVLKHKNGHWTYTTRKHQIKPGDILYYWLYVQKDSLGYRRDDQKHEFTESDVYAGVNSTEESSTEFTSTDYTERPFRPPHPNHGTSTNNHGTSNANNHGTPVNENCNASTPPMRVFPQEVHHYHHHFLPTLAPNGGCPQYGGGNGFSNGGGGFNGGAGSGGFSATSGGGPGGSTGFNFPTSESQNSISSIQQLTHQMKQVMIALENMKLKVATLSDVVDELINSNGNTKLVLTGANVDATTNLFELVRHIVLDKLDLKDLKNDIYSATRTKKGIVFDVASGLDKRRILTRARERLNRDDEELRIQDYYDSDSPKTSEESESIIDVRFGSDE